MNVSRFPGRHFRAALTGAALPLSSAVALVATSLGRSDRRTAGGATRRLAAAGHAAVGLALGVLAVIPVAVLAVVVARGVLYGIVDGGPYDTSWGGPTRAGAWAAHFLIGVPLAVLALFALSGLAALHAGWGRLIAGEPGNRWVVLVTG